MLTKKVWTMLRPSNICLVFLLVITLLFRCSKSKDKEEVKLDLINIDSLTTQPQIMATSLTYKQRDSLLKEVYENGNNDAYYILSNYYINFGKKDDLIKISKFLSNNYNNSTAQYRVYTEMIYLYKNPDCKEVSILCIPENKKELALTYLRMAVKNKNKNAILEYDRLKRERMVK